MTCKWYKAYGEFDPRDNIFVGWALGIEEGISSHGSTVVELKAYFATAIDHYLDDYKASWLKPEKPASGKRPLRITPEIHAKALIMARVSGKSLNQWASALFKKAAHLAK